MAADTLAARLREAAEPEFRIVAGYPLPIYRVGNDGTCWSKLIRRGNYVGQIGTEWRQLAGSRSPDGYTIIKLLVYDRGEAKGYLNTRLHRLILETFVGPCPEGMVCRHLDGNPANNHLVNLRWGTRSENMTDMIRHGTHRDPKLTPDQVLEIRALSAVGLPTDQLASRFGVATSTIWEAATRRTWKHI